MAVMERPSGELDDLIGQWDNQLEAARNQLQAQHPDSTGAPASQSTCSPPAHRPRRKSLAEMFADEIGATQLNLHSRLSGLTVSQSVSPGAPVDQSDLVHSGPTLPALPTSAVSPSTSPFLAVAGRPQLQLSQQTSSLQPQPTRFSLAAARRAGTTDRAEEVICACGNTLLPGANFCHVCGSRTTNSLSQPGLVKRARSCVTELMGRVEIDHSGESVERHRLATLHAGKILGSSVAAEARAGPDEGHDEGHDEGPDEGHDEAADEAADEETNSTDIEAIWKAEQTPSESGATNALPLVDSQELEDSNQELEDQELEDSNQELEGADQELEDGNQELGDSNQELEDQELEDSNQELEGADQELEDGNQELGDSNQEPPPDSAGNRLPAYLPTCLPPCLPPSPAACKMCWFVVKQL